nr:hybrid signal transduction histidine kinase M [Tanacetum cinerariifolium]
RTKKKKLVAILYPISRTIPCLRMVHIEGGDNRSFGFPHLVKTLQGILVTDNPTKAKEAWEIIKGIYLDKKHTHTISLKGELRVIHLRDKTVDAYFQTIESIVTLLHALGSPLSNDDVASSCRVPGIFILCFRHLYVAFQVSSCRVSCVFVSCFRLLHNVFQSSSCRVSGFFMSCFRLLHAMFQESSCRVSGFFVLCFKRIQILFPCEL